MLYLLLEYVIPVKSHLLILQEEQKLSHDEDLKSLLEQLRQKISTTKQPSTFQEVRNLAMDMTSAYVGKELLQKQALLLRVTQSLLSGF